MAARDTIFDAFDRCIDRINAGEAVDAVLQDYREFANDLRPMLEAGLLLPRARFPAEMVETVEQSLEPLIRETVAVVFRGGALAGTTWLLLLLLAGALIAVVVVIASRGGSVPTLSLTPPPSAVPLIAPSLTSLPTLSATPTLTLTWTLTPSVTTSPTFAPTATTSPTFAPSATPSPAVGVIVIEGAVSRIEGSVITIFDRSIILDPNDPRLPALQVGDTVRVEGVSEGVTIRVITLTFVNVTVVVEGEQVWRDDNCATPPPSWAQPSASDWTQRCITSANDGSNPGNGNAGGENGGGGDNDDDDDDD